LKYIEKKSDTWMMSLLTSKGEKKWLISMKFLIGAE